jgi:hypothetical protein
MHGASAKADTEGMRCAHALTAALLAVAAPASAAPLFGGDDLQRNGALSRHVWTPGLASGEIADVRVSAGIALGLRGGVRDNLGRSVAAAFTLHLPRGSSVSLLPAGDRGAMLVLQTRH